LLGNPELVRTEIHRRIKAIQDARPTKRRKITLEKEIIRVRKSIKKLLDAYQEDLLQLDELRSRVPELRRREAALKSELHNIESASADQQAILRVANNIESFLLQLRKTADTMSVLEQQKVLRLVVKEILVDAESITIKHSIPFTKFSDAGRSKLATKVPSYLLRSGRHHTALRCPFLALRATAHLPSTTFVSILDRRFKPELDQPKHITIHDSASYTLH
jgi:site-specific DNA recombinase